MRKLISGKIADYFIVIVSGVLKLNTVVNVFDQIVIFVAPFLAIKDLFFDVKNKLAKSNQGFLCFHEYFLCSGKSKLTLAG